VTATHIQLYDTTLRDGMQGEGMSLSAGEKLRVAHRLDELGVDFVEAGFPSSNPKELELFALLERETFGHAQIAAFGMTRRREATASADAGLRVLADCFAPVCTLVGKTWSLHLEKVVRVDREENLRMIAESVGFLVDQDKRVVYDAEHFFDGWRDDRDYALACLRAAADAGAETVVPCDTNGGSLPPMIDEAMRDVVAQLGPSGARIGIHCHDDAGCGVANSLAGVRQGATHVQGTINGFGERTGNCNITTVIPILHFKLKKGSVPQESLARLTELSQFVDETANLRPNPRLPWVGAAAFSHKGGTHVNAVQKALGSYEHVDPASVGNTRHVLISDLAGRSNIVMKARELGFDLSKETAHLKTMLERIKEMEHRGYEFEAADGSLALLIRRVLSHEPPPFTVEAYHVSMRSEGASSVCEATVKVKVGNDRAHTVADGDGPVNALDAALRSALVTLYPQLEAVRLTDYKVRIIDSTSGTAATTRVLIQSSDGVSEWGTIGVNENIIEASLQALVDSLECALIKSASGLGAR